MPLYVDGVPSHVLPFLKEMNGFIEGRQNEPIMHKQKEKIRKNIFSHDRSVIMSFSCGI